MKIQVKKLDPKAVIPSKASEGAIGYDLTAISMKETDTYIEYGTGLAIEPCSGYYTLIYPRSSISKYDLVLCNSIGLIDEDYRGELILRFRKMAMSKKEEATDPGMRFIVFTENNSLGIQHKLNYYQIGDKIGQLVVQKRLDVEQFEVVGDLSNTQRGEGGFGSTGI